MPVLVLLALFALAAPSGAQESPDPLPGQVRWGNISIHDAEIARRIASLAERSPRFRAGLDSLRAFGPPTLVGARRPSGADGSAFGEGGVGQVLPVTEPGTAGDVLFFVVMLDIGRMHAIYRTLDVERHLDADLDILIAHEIFGHVVPSATDRRSSRVCRDPTPGEQQDRPDIKGCSVARENLIRADLGYPRRPSYRDAAMHIGALWAFVRTGMPPATGMPGPE